MSRERKWIVSIALVCGLAAIVQLSGCVRLNEVRAVLEVSRQEGMAPLSVTFSLGQSSTGGVEGSYFLEFGDGTSLVEGEDFSLAVPHVYQAAGTYVAELTVIGSKGEMKQDVVEIVATGGLPDEGSDPGNLAFDFTAQSTDGAQIVLSDLRGQVVLIEFWGSWCTPCRESMPHINSLWEQFHDQGFVALAVSTDASAADSIQFLETNGFDGLICLWEPGEKQTRIKVLYDIEWIPRTVVIDRQGIVRYNAHPMSLQASFIASLLEE